MSAYRGEGGMEEKCTHILVGKPQQDGKMPRELRRNKCCFPFDRFYAGETRVSSIRTRRLLAVQTVKWASLRVRACVAE